MSNPPLNPTSFRYPFELKDQPSEVVQAHRYAFQGLTDLNQAIAAMSAKINAIKAGATTVINSSGGGGAVPIPTPSPIPGLGGIRDETGLTAYTPLTADNGSLIIFNDASPVAVTLNSAMVTPFFFFVTSFGAGVVTLTPSSGLVNGAASYAIQTGGLFWVGFDGTNWHSSDVLTLAQTFTAVTHEWLKSYDASTGLFTATRPDYSDLTGTPTLPATIAPVAGEYLTGYDSTTGLFSASTTAGIDATIVTAALTTLGTQGSMTFTKGILTAQTPAT